MDVVSGTYPFPRTPSRLILLVRSQTGMLLKQFSDVRLIKHMQNNIMVDDEVCVQYIVSSDAHSLRQGEAIVADFPMANVLWNHHVKLLERGPPRHDAREEVMRYIAPELWERDTWPTFKTDVWSFGMVLYHVLTDVKPYYAEGYKTEVQVGYPIARDRILPDRPVKEPKNRWITDDVWQLFLDCCRFDPEERIDMEEVYQRLVKIEQATLAEAAQV